MRIADGGVWLADHIYTILWVTRGKIPILFADSRITVMNRLVNLVRAEVSPTAGAVPGYPRYDESQNVTVWAVRAPVYDTVLSPRIEDVYEKGVKIFTGLNSPFYKLFEMVDSYYLEATGKVHRLPFVIYSEMRSGAMDDPIGLGNGGGGIGKAIEDILRPAKTVLTWGLAAVVGFGLFRVYQIVDRQMKGGR